MVSLSGKEPQNVEGGPKPRKQNSAHRRIKEMTSQFSKKWAARELEGGGWLTHIRDGCSLAGKLVNV